MAFVDDLRLASLDNDRATVQPVPGRRDIARFANTDARRKRLSDELMTILGRRVEVVIDLPEHTGSTTSAPPGSPGGGTTEPTSRGVSATDRRAAMELPLVRDAIEAFPDAMPIEFREEHTD